MSMAGCVEFVKFDSKYAALAWKLLGRTLVVESLQEAVELAQGGPLHL